MNCRNLIECTWKGGGGLSPTKIIKSNLVLYDNCACALMLVQYVTNAVVIPYRHGGVPGDGAVWLEEKGE